MRLGVIDVGSNTVHLVVVDAHPGGYPWPVTSHKSLLRLAERIDPSGGLTEEGADALVGAVREASRTATGQGADELLAFATSAVRDATNCARVLARVRAETGVELRVLSGADEAALTFLAVRRWFGASAGRLLVLDLGGGSLEVAYGAGEEATATASVPLGAGRLTREWLGGDDPPSDRRVNALREHVAGVLAGLTSELGEVHADRAVGTSKTFRSLARLAGAAPAGAGILAPRQLTRDGLDTVLELVATSSSGTLAARGGVRRARAHQLVAGGVVAAEALRRLGLPGVDICPWALREGLILHRLDAPSCQVVHKG